MEPLDFAEPDRNHARGADDERALADRARGEQGEDLDGLTQAHLVSQQGMSSKFAETAEPGDALGLIWTEVSRQVIGRRGFVEACPSRPSGRH
jgi:hypothetical protein